MSGNAKKIKASEITAATDITDCDIVLDEEGNDPPDPQPDPRDRKPAPK